MKKDPPVGIERQKLMGCEIACAPIACIEELQVTLLGRNETIKPHISPIERENLPDFEVDQAPHSVACSTIETAAFSCIPCDRSIETIRRTIIANKTGRGLARSSDRSASPKGNAPFPSAVRIS